MSLFNTTPKVSELEQVRCIIAGGRDFTDATILWKKCFELFVLGRFLDTIEIISGGAKGADKLGEKFARVHKIKIKKFPAHWQIFGPAAGAIRNAEMAEYANMLIAFWDGKSRGTAHMIETARKKALLCM